jgi:hypothetical protein
LFPTIYLQTKGIHVYKKYSFDLVRKDFNKNIWTPIDIVSSIRKNWKTPNKMLLIDTISNINPLLAYQINSKYWDLSNEIFRLNNINIKKIVEEIYIFSKKAQYSIKF